jgi:uncharacterized protein (DUF2164 family)
MAEGLNSMAKINQRIETEVDSLLETGTGILRAVVSSSSGIKGDELSKVASWVTRLGQLIRNLYGENSQHFESYASALKTNSFYNLYSGYNSHFSQMLGVVTAIKHDIDNGLLTNFKTLIQADIFADFLEMGEYLLNGGYKDAAAVIIGSVLEDGLRKLAEKNKISITNDQGKPLTIEPLNNELAKKEVYSKLIQKQITSWAHIRNKAAHGEFNEYNKEQVQMMLLFVQSFTSDYLQ